MIPFCGTCCRLPVNYRTIFTFAQTKPDFTVPTDQIVASYQMNVGNPYLEWLTFNFGRYLLATSARGALLANLQGKWGDGWTNAWSAGACSLLRIKQYL